MKQLVLISSFLAFLLFSCGNDDSDAFNEQLALDILNIDEYLETNNIQTEIHSSGIRYVVEVEGTGDAPSFGDDIAVKYEAFLLTNDRRVIDEDTIGFTINLSSTVVEAWQIMLPTMNEGGSITFYAPSVYCFGEDGSVVPRNSNLIYRVELLARVDDENEQQQVDEAIIDEFLLENGIAHEIDDSGIRFSTITEGTGDNPVDTSRVEVIYEGSFLNGSEFDASNDAEPPVFQLQDLIEAWQIMLPTVMEGGSIKIYTPSRYGYGSTGNSSIPPNTILVFEIELLSIVAEEDDAE